MAKVICSEAIWRVVDRSMQILGGLGITDDTIVARLFRDVRPFRIYAAPPKSTAGRSPAACCARERQPSPSVRTHSEGSLDHGGPRSDQNRDTGEGRCPWQNWVPAFPTEH